MQGRACVHHREPAALAEAEPELRLRVTRTHGDARKCRICRVLTLTRIEFNGPLGVMYDACDEHATIFEGLYRQHLAERRTVKSSL